MGRRKREGLDPRKGVFRYIGGDGKARLGRHTPICDFCMGDPEKFPVRWSYPCGPVKVTLPGSLITDSDDDWAACAYCHALIEQGMKARAALITRIITVQTERFRPGARMGRLELMKLVHQMALHLEKFEEARTGPAEPEESFYPPADLRPDDG